MPPNFWASSVASSWTTSTMSSTVTMPFILPFMSTTGTTVRSCSAKIRDTVSWSISSVTRTTSVSMMSATIFLGSAANRSRNDTTPSRCWSGVDHVRVVDGLELVARLAAQVADRLVGGHRGAQPGVAGRHQAAGLVLGVGQQRRDLLAGRRVEQARAAWRGGPRRPPGSRRRRRRARAGASTGGAGRTGSGAAARPGRWRLSEMKKSSASSRGSTRRPSPRSSRSSSGQASRSSSADSASSSSTFTVGIGPVCWSSTSSATSVSMPRSSATARISAATLLASSGGSVEISPVSSAGFSTTGSGTASARSTRSTGSLPSGHIEHTLPNRGGFVQRASVRSARRRSR